MTASGISSRARAAAAALCLLLPVGCAGAQRPEPPPARDGVQRLFDRQAAALEDGDRAAYLAVLDPEADALRRAQRQVFDNLVALPLARYRHLVTAVREEPDGDGRRLTAEVELSHRLRGHDDEPVTATERFTVVRRDGRWYLAGERADSATQLWEQGHLTVQRGRRSLVLGVGQDRAALEELAAEADRAVRTVSAAWPGHWPRRTVVLAPADVGRMAEMLSSPPGDYRGIAAVTSSAGHGGPRQDPDGGTPHPEGDPPAPAARVIVNPEAYGLLGSVGRQVVMTHETTHVATRGDTTGATGMWLSEGFADWVGYQEAEGTDGGDRTDGGAARYAPALQEAVRAGELPGTLPPDGDFAFGGPDGRLARAYEGGWLACRLIAAEWGEETLVDFYLAAGRDGAAAGFRDVLGVGEREFTDRWRASLRRLFD